MKYLTSDFLDFYKDLAANNNRDWFQANKKRYETSVKKPFELFVAAVIQELAKTDKSMAVSPSDCIFRINRDVRFSKDKTPYKLHSSAVVSASGKKGVADIGIYFELGPERMAIGGGCYQPDKEQLERIREAIAKNPKGLMKAVNDAKFKKAWGEMQGEKNKILAPEFKAVAEDCPLIFNKQFFYWVELDSSIITSGKLMDTLLKYREAATPVKDFLEKALK